MQGTIDWTFWVCEILHESEKDWSFFMVWEFGVEEEEE